MSKFYATLRLIISQYKSGVMLLFYFLARMQVRRTPENTNKSSAAETGNRGHNRHRPKRGEAGSPPNTMSPGPRSTSVQSGVFIHDPSSRLATIDMGPELGCVPLLGDAATPSNTTSRGPRFTSVPNGILIHPAV